MTQQYWYVVKRHGPGSTWEIVDGVHAYNADHAKYLARKWNWWRPSQYLTVSVRLDAGGIQLAKSSYDMRRIQLESVEGLFAKETV